MKITDPVLVIKSGKRFKVLSKGGEMILILSIIYFICAGFATTLEHPGLELLRKKGCLVCHSIDGSKLIGPTLKGLYGSQRDEVTPDGLKKILADSAFIRRAIYEPDAEMALGSGKSLMKTYRDIVSESELRMIIEYMKTLSVKENQ
jgi:cytochrome c551/c552